MLIQQLPKNIQSMVFRKIINMLLYVSYKMNMVHLVLFGNV